MPIELHIKVVCVKMTIIERTKSFDKELSRIPEHIRRKFMLWVKSVEVCGIEKIRNEENGYCDKVLKGQRKGQYSIRLNKEYRAFYREDKSTNTIKILEVNKHDY